MAGGKALLEEGHRLDHRGREGRAPGKIHGGNDDGLCFPRLHLGGCHLLEPPVDHAGDNERDDNGKAEQEQRLMLVRQLIPYLFHDSAASFDSAALARCLRFITCTSASIDGLRTARIVPREIATP